MTASLILMAFLALSSINFSSACRRSDNPISQIPTTRRSLISSDFIFTRFSKIVQSSDTLFGRLTLVLHPVIKPCPFKDHVFRHMKKNCRTLKEHLVYIRRCVSVMFVKLRTLSASSLRQYNKVLICLWSLSSQSPEAIQYCSNLFFQCGRLLKVKRFWDF